MDAVTENVQQPFRYTGRELDLITGLCYVRNRWYDPAAARFVSEDPIGLAGGINLYAYAANSPTNLRDPMGLNPECGEEEEAVQITVQLTEGGTARIWACRSKDGKITIPVGGVVATSKPKSDWGRAHSGPYEGRVRSGSTSDFYRLEAESRSLQFLMEVSSDWQQREEQRRERCSAATVTFALVWAGDGLTVLSMGALAYTRAPMLVLGLGGQRLGALGRGSPETSLDWRYAVPLLATLTAQKQMESAC